MAYFFKWPMYTHAILGHVWSLAVEEQFYIIFPFVVYFSSTSTLKKIVISIILICPLIRLCSALFIVNMVSNRFWLGEFIYTNPFCQADALATGALLALYPIKIKFPYLIFFIVSLLFITVGLTCFLFLRKAGYFLVAGSSLGFDFPAFCLDEKSPWLLLNIRSFYQYSLVNLLAFTLIAPAVGQKGIFPLIFESKPVVYFGKISYGVYLFHGPVLAFFIMGFDYFGGWQKFTSQMPKQILVFIVYLSVVIALAHLSYKYFERKIIDKYAPKIN